MTYDQLRHQYPEFIYKNFSSQVTGNHLEIEYHFSAPPDHNFAHRLTFTFPDTVVIPENSRITDLIFHLGLSLIPSYWKLTCSPVIKITAGGLSPSQTDFWHKLLIKGMGEYYYKNRIDFTVSNFLTLNSSSPDTFSSPAVAADLPPLRSDRVIVPVGGGKDSIVTLELLKSHFKLTPFVINPNPITDEVIKISRLSDPITVKSTFDPLLFDLNRQGYLNGHTPVSAFYTFSAVLAAVVSSGKFIAFSNERSSNEGNTVYLNQEINHQYSKTLEFESDLQTYLRDLSPDLNCFSFLRPLYEIQITEIFSRYPEYFPVFSSCNQNFKLYQPLSKSSVLNTNSKWCGHCPKCVSTALMLACFIGKDEVMKIMGVYPPDLPENRSLLDDLLGKNPVKPFECVLSRPEAVAAYASTKDSLSPQLQEILLAWQDNPNLPENFASVLSRSLKSA